MNDDYKDIFNAIYDDSARLVMVIVSGRAGIELQIFERDSSTKSPTMAFLMSDDNITEFMRSRMAGERSTLYLTGATIADIESSKQTGEMIPGIKINRGL